MSSVWWMESEQAGTKFRCRITNKQGQNKPGVGMGIAVVDAPEDFFVALYTT